jgi:hypothetical protein
MSTREIIPASVAAVDQVDDEIATAIAAIDAAGGVLRAARALLVTRQRAATSETLYHKDNLPPGAESWDAVCAAHRDGRLQGARRVGRKLVVPASAWAAFVAATPPRAKREKAADPLDAFSDKPARVA